jgi:hypothetical protein
VLRPSAVRRTALEEVAVPHTDREVAPVSVRRIVVAVVEELRTGPAAAVGRILQVEHNRLEAGKDYLLEEGTVPEEAVDSILLAEGIDSEEGIDLVVVVNMAAVRSLGREVL